VASRLARGAITIGVEEGPGYGPVVPGAATWQKFRFAGGLTETRRTFGTFRRANCHSGGKMKIGQSGKSSLQSTKRWIKLTSQG